MTACVSRKSALLLGAHHPLDPVLAAGLAADRPAEPAQRLAARARGRPCRTASAGARAARPGTAGATGCASNSKAWVVSWRAIQVRNGPSGTPSARAVARMFSSTNRSRPGRGLGGQQREVVLAQDAAAHEPEQEPELAGRDPAIGQRHGRLGEAAAGRDDLVEQVRLELAHQRRERAGVGADPARPIDDAGPLDDARQRAAERRRQGRHDAGHRLGVGGLGGPQLGRVRVPGRCAAGRWRSARPPASRRGRAARPLLGAPAGDRRGGAQRGPDQEPGLPDAVVAPRRPASPA